MRLSWTATTLTARGSTLIFTASRAMLVIPIIGIVRQAVRPQPVILRMNGQSYCRRFVGLIASILQSPSGGQLLVLQWHFGGCVMAEDTSKTPVTTDEAPSALRPQRPLEGLRQEINRLFDDSGIGTWRSPFGSSLFDIEPFRRAKSAFTGMPAVDVTETEQAFKVVAELPGMDEKNIEVKVANGMLTIKGEKQEEKEEGKQDYYVRERSFGSFERTFKVPDGVDLDKVDASFKKGVLTVTLPKTAEAQKAEKKITVRTE